MSQEAIGYLERNRSKFPKGILIEALRNSGYPEADVESSIRAVYGQDGVDRKKGQTPPPAIPARESGKIYQSDGEKAKDLFIGLFFGVLFAIIPVIGWLLGIIFLFRYYNRYRWQFYGIVAGFAIGFFFYNNLKLFF